MADEDIPSIDENPPDDEERKAEGKGGDGAEGEESSEDSPKKGKFSIKLPLGLTPILLGVIVVALASAYLSMSSLMKMGTYRQRLDTALAAARDPANLAHFQQANQRVLKSPIYKPNELFIVYGSDFGVDWEMLRALREEGVLNRSLPHQNMNQLLLRFEQDVLDLQPRAFLLMPSLTHMKETQNALIKSKIMCDLASNLGIEPILVKLPPVPADQDTTAGGFRGKIISYNRGLAQIAASNGWPVLDLFTPLATPEYYLKEENRSDYLWPNLTGYRLLTNQMRAMVDSIAGSGPYQARSSAAQGTLRTADR